MKKNLIILFVLGPLLAISLISIHVLYILKSPNSTNELTFSVKSGEAFPSINGRLFKSQIISNPRIFHYLARYKNVMSKFKKGTFLIPANVNMEEVLNILVYGQPILVSITIPEGKNIYDIAQILEDQNFGPKDTFLSLMKDSQFVKRLGLDADTLEGYLFPETYKVDPETSPQEILSMMTRLFKQKTQGLLTHPELSPHEVITLASVVEKETGAKSERPLIASVFVNRLKKRMRLQSDPTTIYGIIEKYNGNITKQDLLTPSPYNTYTLPALPKGPIACPSLEAIKAVINPAQSEYLFFVSKNDGTHEFTKNYSDHLKAVKFYQLNRSQREGKSWRQLNQ